MKHSATDEASGEEDDRLGYYPDGVKRTLTDDQIAMFRHSEIYAIIRERQVRRENADVESNETWTPSPKSGSAAPVEQYTVAKKVSNGDSDEEEEYARFLQAEQKAMQDEAMRRKKRKRSNADGDLERERMPTMRRIAREMDEAWADNTVLDYGEGDAPTGKAASQEQGLGAMNGRKSVSYEDESVRNAPPEQPPVREGRKIWWPVIGGP